MKKIIFFLLFFLFLASPFCQMEMLHSNRGILIAQTPIATPVATSTGTTQSSNIFADFFNWLFGLFSKTDYTINTRPIEDVNSDMSDYGNKNENSFKEKHSFAGSRVTDSTGQICLKGNVIKKVILGESGYSDSTLSNESNTGCPNKTIKDLAHYFVQINEKFYCAADNNQLINIEQNIIDKVNSIYSSDIPSQELSCYQEIYNDFYLTPKGNNDEKEENAKKMIQTPISKKDQNQNYSNADIKDQLNQNFSPDGTSAGLSGLRPSSW